MSRPLSASPALVVLQVTPALDAGGVERTTIEVAQAVSEAGGRALVATRGGRLEPELKEAGGELLRLPLDTKNPFEMATNAMKLRRIAGKEGVRLIHARSRAPAWSALYAARKLNLPFVTTYHGIYNAKSGLKRFYNGVMARGDVVIANSEYTRAHVLETHKIPPGRVVTIPRGADPVRFDPASVDEERRAAARKLMRLPAEPDGALTVLAPARLTSWKGQRFALLAARETLNRRPGSIRLVLAGDAQGRGDYVRDLERMIGTLNLGDEAFIPGHIVDMPAALAVADIALFPVTEPEAFGRAAVEAQMMGAPVIASRLGGLAETIQDGVTGWLTPPGDPEAISAALDRLIESGPEARREMGARGQARARKLYSTRALQAATLEVYRRLIREAA